MGTDCFNGHTGRKLVTPEDVSPFTIVKSVSDEQIQRNMVYALALGLQQVRRCPPHDLVLAIAGGGPSIADTYGKLRNPGPNTRVVAVNGSHDWLIAKGIVPFGCAFLDPNPRVAELFTPHHDVLYFVASCCDASVFDKLKGYNVRLWHAAGQTPEDKTILNKGLPDWLLVGGGSTVSLRCIMLGYMLGFRDFRLHGFDSSSRNGKRHAYAQDDGVLPDEITYQGYRTTPAWLVQMTDFFALLDRFNRPDMNYVTIKMYGDGLLQSEWKRFRKECGNPFSRNKERIAA